MHHAVTDSRDHRYHVIVAGGLIICGIGKLHDFRIRSGLISGIAFDPKSGRFEKKKGCNVSGAGLNCLFPLTPGAG